MESVIESFADKGLLDLTQLRTFVTVCELRSFTAAARSLQISQSTASLHVRRLESTLRCVLLLRNTHSVVVTDRGDALVSIARSMLRANARAFESLSPSTLRGHVRLGVSEDFVLSRLPSVLSSFRRDHPLVELQLVVGLSAVLTKKLERRELDLMLGKRLPSSSSEDIVFRDELVWFGHRSLELEKDETVPLLLYPPPSVSRAAALSVLEAGGRKWRIACTSGSLTGLFAAAAAGLGILAHARTLRPPGLQEISGSARLPNLPTIEFVAIARMPADEPTLALRNALQEGQRRLVADN